MSAIRSPIRDSSIMLSQLAADAQRKRFKVKQTAKFSSSSAVVFVPRPPAPLVCVCKGCRELTQHLKAA